MIQPLSANSFASSAGISERQLSPETATHTRLIKGFSRGSTRYYGGAASSVYLSVGGVTASGMVLKVCGV